jgi:hypothetical protein
MKGEMQAAEGQASAAGPVLAYLRPLDSLAGTLEGTLPTGSRLVVLWDDPLLGPGRSSLRRLPASLLEAGMQALDQGAGISGDEIMLCDAWSEDGARIAIAVLLRQAFAGASREGWLALARRMVATTLRRRVRRPASSRCRKRSACSMRCTKSPTWPGRGWKWVKCCRASTPSSAS